ncbi:MAG: Rieske (2Fe-2S) protein [Bacteroidota bacterium]|nr:Rieske (2Fe-2S) protein [Bacteroidota bacterium]MDP4233703.1 Rieske (2Fe-2S) protein [Bacteroidota bacterium]MDP4242342.1 Rieske (2Fe-2S) protein [Bacteroidota bacterium]MDP4288705.1 Rieske (2Fe-2S) protein [Bacteroidota bacterium]
MKQHVFSLDTAVGRREFLKRTGMVLTGITLSGALAEFLASCSSLTGPSVSHGTTTISVADLTSDGSFKEDTTVQPDGTPILVIRQNATTYTALSMLCTHQGCQVNPPSGGMIFCACHASRFDLHGNVMSGPAPSALTNYGVAYNASAKSITVTY